MEKLKSENADVQAGINIVLRALETPIRQIVENSGVEGSIVVNKVMESRSESYGFDAQSETYVDMVTAGIIDPTKVVRTALQDASSVAPPTRITATPPASLARRSCSFSLS